MLSEMVIVSTRRIKLGLLWAGSCVLTLLIGFLAGSENHVPFVGHEEIWSIGIYEGSSALDLRASSQIENPVLTAADVTDVRANIVADPFVIGDGEQYHMFFEVWNKATGQGDIGLAGSPDGLRWDYQQIVIDEPFHLSYPYVFRWENDYYMIPESGQDRSVRLYKATSFPHQWQLQATLLWGYDYADPSIFRHDDRWWLFVSFTRSDILRLYHADHLEGPWTEHPESPIIRGDPRIARPGGRVLQVEDRLYRLTQDDYQSYGSQLRAFEITELTPATYAEVPASEAPILTGSGAGWNATGMHHADHHFIEGRWLVYVDGRTKKTVFGWQH